MQQTMPMAMRSTIENLHMMTQDVESLNQQCCSAKHLSTNANQTIINNKKIETISLIVEHTTHTYTSYAIGS